MLSTGDQLRAARMLARLDQADLAALSGVSIGTVRNIEARGAKAIRSNHVTVRALIDAIGGAGVEFLDEGIGVRLKQSAATAERTT